MALNGFIYYGTKFSQPDCTGTCSGTVRGVTRLTFESIGL